MKAIGFISISPAVNDLRPLVGSENINVSECDVDAGKAFMKKVRASK